MGAPGMIVPDTVTFRLLGEVFAQDELNPALREPFVLSPITCIEVLSQIAGGGREEVLRQIRAMPHWVNANHVRLLPWMTDVLSINVFGVHREEDMTPQINAAFEACFQLDGEPLIAAARPLRHHLDEIKDETADAFQRLLDSYRAERPTDETVLDIIITSIGNRLDLPVSQLVLQAARERLSAYLEFELVTLKNAAQAAGYVARNHRNDIFDVEQLVFLSEPGLHFLTLDRGFSRIAQSAQRDRIHVVPRDQFGTPESVEALLRTIALLA